MTKSIKPGTKVWYRNAVLGRVAATVVEFHPEIKNGRSGYDVKLDVPVHGEDCFWGYLDQVTPRTGGAA